MGSSVSATNQGNKFCIGSFHDGNFDRREPTPFSTCLAMPSSWATEERENIDKVQNILRLLWDMD